MARRRRRAEVRALCRLSIAEQTFVGALVSTLATLCPQAVSAVAASAASRPQRRRLPDMCPSFCVIRAPTSRAVEPTVCPKRNRRPKRVAWFGLPGEDAVSVRPVRPSASCSSPKASAPESGAGVGIYAEAPRFVVSSSKWPHATSSVGEFVWGAALQDSGVAACEVGGGQDVDHLDVAVEVAADGSDCRQCLID